MKKTVLSLLVAVIMFVAHAQTATPSVSESKIERHDIAVQVYPVCDSTVKNLEKLIFSASDNTIRHYDNKNQLDMYLEKTTSGGVWVITFTYDAFGKRNEYDRVYFYCTPKYGGTGWSVDGEYQNKGYIPSLLQKVTNTLL